MATYVADGSRVDGSWELNILVTDLQVEKRLRVTSDLHVGGVLVKLVQALDIALDWSDHALWWPEKNKWLLRARSTLNQYNVLADAKLEFTPMHKILKVQVPDLQVLELRMDFSVNCFAAVVQTCKELGIRHPEELSFQRKLGKDDLKRVAKDVQKRKKMGEADPMGPRSPMGPLSPNGTNQHHNSSGSLDDKLSPYPNRSPMGPSPTSTLVRSANSPNNLSSSISGYNTINGTLSPGSMHSLSFEGIMESSLSNSPPVPSKEAFQHLHRPKNLAEKARVNCAWLDSSRSLMEQGIRDKDIIMLKFKFYNFYDLKPRYDAVRINQIYEQAKWTLISEELDCNEDEMIYFAALQLQVQIQSHLSQPDLDQSQNMNNTEDDEIDAALKDLQESLEGSAVSSHGDITYIPELSDYLRFFKPKKLTLKNFKRYYAVFKDTCISFYRSKEECHGPTVVPKIDIRGCETQPDVNLLASKYGIKLFVPEDEGMSEICLRFDSEEQYCNWMAACKLASKGKTMADSSYHAEVEALQNFLSMQHPVSSPNTTNVDSTPNQLDIQPEDFVAPRFIRKIKSKTLIQRILEGQARVQDKNLMEAKLAFIQAWQSLSEYGITYFRIKMSDAKKEELMCIASNRIIRMDLHTGDSLKTWRYHSLQKWDVNWEVKNVILNFDSERVIFASMECSCKTIHEYIGGYIFLSMRSMAKNQTLDEEEFHKLTGGWYQ